MNIYTYENYNTYRNHQSRQPTIKNKMKILARDQWVGDGDGYYFKRDLWEDENGNRISIRKGEGIWKN
jgi:hypothetical protein